MNYTHFSHLGYTTRHSSVSSHPYRIVNPVSSRKENYLGLRSTKALRRTTTARNVIDYSGSGDKDSFLNFLQNHPISFVWFHAVWCGHCVNMKEEYEEASNKLEGKVSFIKINADNYPQLCKLYGVESYPMIKLFKNGKVTADYSGKRTAVNFINWLDSNIDKQ